MKRPTVDELRVAALNEMVQIKMYCRGCGEVHDLNVAACELPFWVREMGCNWCPMCEGYAKEYYREWYIRRKAAPGKCPTERWKQLEIKF